MYPKSYEEACEVDRVQMTYETQIQKLHRIADGLATKVAHISISGLEQSKAVPTQPHSTRLNRELEEVINHFETILENINN